MSAFFLLKRMMQVSVSELLFRLNRHLLVKSDQKNPSYKNLRFVDGLSKKERKKPQAYKIFWEQKRDFYFSQEDRRQMLKVFQDRFPHYLPQIIQNANSILRWEIPIFGKIFHYQNHIEWHKDPISQKEWPKIHWSKISVVDGNEKLDAKWIWELNRHQFLLAPAIAYWATEDERYAQFILNLLLSWVEQNPPSIGINWLESLEIATRLVVWIWVLELLRGAKCLHEEVLLNLLDSLMQQASHVARYLSFYISPNTHLTGEALGLFLVGSMYPEYLLANDWSALSQKILEDEVTNQFGDDAVHSELSTYYHCYSVDYYLQFLLLANKQGREVRKTVPDQLEKMLYFLMHISRPDGTLPMLGDDDGGRALPLSSDHYNSATKLLGIGALLFQRSDLKKQSMKSFEDAVWLFGSRFEAVETTVNEHESEKKYNFFQDANYMTYRTTWDKDAHYALFDAGRMGFLSAGHSHADYLHFELAAHGFPVLVDRGTYSYKERLWRNYARGTSAHNSVCIDGKNQVPFYGSFSWKKIPGPGRGKLLCGPSFAVMESEQTCYKDIRHKRSLMFFGSDVIVCRDSFKAKNTHQYEYFLQLFPGVSVSAAGDISYNLLVSSDVLVRTCFLFSESTEIMIENGNEKDPIAHHFPRYGSKMNAITIRLKEVVEGDNVRYMIFVPSRTQLNVPAINVVKNTIDFKEFEVRWNERKIVFQESFQDVSIYQTPLYIICCKRIIAEWKGDFFYKLALFGPTSIEIGGELLFQTLFPLEYVIIEEGASCWKIFLPDEADAEIQCDLLWGKPISLIRWKQ